MKTSLKMCAAALALALAGTAGASDRDVLHDLIFGGKSLCADYAQTVYAKDGRVLQEQSGQIYLLRPNYFRLDTAEPDASTIVADGTDVWSYDEMLGQVTVYSFSRQIAGSPLMLLISEDDGLWDGYTILRSSADSFSVLPVKKDSNVRSMTLTFRDGRVSGLKYVENDGKYSEYVFTPKEDPGLTPSDFKYVIPEGVTVDDQRTK